MKDIKTLIILILCSILCMAMVHIGDKPGTYQAVVSDDGMTLIVVDTRNGAYKVRDVGPGDEEKELFNARERILKDWDAHQLPPHEPRLLKSSGEPSLFKCPGHDNLLKTSGEPSLFKGEKP